MKKILLRNVYYELRQRLLQIATRSYYKLQQVRYYKLQKALLQIATVHLQIATLLQIATVHVS